MQISWLPTAITALVLGIAQPVLTLPTEPRHAMFRRTVPLPADDPFYTPPAGFESQVPGAVLRSRSVDASFFSDVPDPVFGYQLLYRTTAINGSAIASVTTIFKPLLSYPDRFVSYATAYDSSATECDPSYAYQLGSDSSDNSDTDEEFLFIEGYLLQGYTVSSSDYEGPDAAFTPGHLEGMCLLDSLRAVSNYASSLGFNTKTPAIVAYGYSGGAIATGWAATLQDSYAPELPVKAWIHGGTPVNLTGVLLYDANTSNSGYLPAAVAGLAKPSAYGAQLQPILDEILTSDGQTALAYANSHCMSDDLNQYEFISLLSYQFQTLGPALLQQPTLSAILQENIMGLTSNLTPKAPVLLIHALQDEIIPYANASALAQRYCSRGVDITFTTYEKGGHVSTAIVSAPETYTYVNNAFAGKLGSGCTYNSQLNATLSIVGLIVELEPIISKLVDILKIKGITA